MEERYVSIGNLAATRALPTESFAVLEALASLIVPTDGHGPGAIEARVAIELDRTLIGNPARRMQYFLGLRAFDDYARTRFGSGFPTLPHHRQLELLSAVHQAGERIHSEAGSLAERAQRKISYWYYARWHRLLPLIEFWIIVRADVLTVFYSSREAWDWLGYDGPPFPNGYVNDLRTANS
ncbi:MAG: gluconate 2-dehydrogenase subunit 3 family protein [Nitrospirota bacterium]